MGRDPSKLPPSSTAADFYHPQCFNIGQIVGTKLNHLIYVHMSHSFSEQPDKDENHVARSIECEQSNWGSR